MLQSFWQEASWYSDTEIYFGALVVDQVNLDLTVYWLQHHSKPPCCKLEQSKKKANAREEMLDSSISRFIVTIDRLSGYFAVAKYARHESYIWIRGVSVACESGGVPGYGEVDFGSHQ